MKKLLLTTTTMLMAATLAVAQTIPNYVPADGLVAWYPFNGNTNDESGKANNLTGFSTSTTDRNGIADAARSFNGFSDYLSLAMNQTVSPGISISIWANSTGFGTSNNQTLVNLTSANQLSMNSIYFNAQNLVANGVVSPVQTPGFSVEQSAWKHYVLTSDSATNTVKLYIDGILKHTANTPLETVLRTELNIGRHHSDNWGYGWYFNGKLDDMGLWNRTLTEQEVTNLFTASLPQANCLPNYVPNNGLVAWYPFCGNANDESGNGNNGLVKGASLTSDKKGNVNSAYSFNGSSYIDIPASNTLNPGQISVSAWVLYTVPAGGYKSIVSNWKDNGVNNRAYNIAINPDNNFHSTISPDGSPNSTNCNSNSSVPINVWKHLLVTYDNTALKVYVDGVLSNTCSATIASPIYTDANSLIRIGAKNVDIPTEFFYGKLDDIGIWDRVLTQQEITNLFTESIPQSACLPNYVPNNGLVAWYPFCGNANDESGNGNNGIAKGATLATDRNGSANNAYSFNGTNDHIQLPLLSAFNNQEKVTISFWENSNHQQGGTVISHWTTQQIGGPIGLVLDISDNGKFGSSFIGGIGFNTPNVILSANLWNHVVFVYDGSLSNTTERCAVYVNGVFNSYYGNPSVPSTIGNTAESTVIGAAVGPSMWWYFNGRLDDMGIWNRALTEQEIKGLYDGTPTSLVSSMSKANLKVYPNPASDQLTVISDYSFLESIFEIKDVLGKVWVSGKLEPHRNRIDINTLKPGIYFLSIKGNSKQVVKFIKV